ncbi:aminotransferase class V-fold PLP-dependent enzyme [Actinosynnema sp. NPDC020468]|uniref:aminotransferase class V-fold PLP-dependent enzyme n=1 Tax=Actinosynnema sp. NPDC020468 TaxID=3154488 RepID=UPI0033D52437
MDGEVIDLARARADTPGALDRVFLDSAGSSLPPTPVLDAVVSHLRREAEVGGYVAARERADDLADGYRVLARLFGAEPDEIAFTDSATRSWLAVFDAVPLGPGDRVVITEAEYAGNAVPILHRAKLDGVAVDVVPSAPDGRVDLEALKAVLTPAVKLVSLVHVPTNGGLVNPVREVVEAAHEVGALVLLDACQSAGQLDLAVEARGVDLISATGRKWLRGPRGTGVLVVRRQARDRLRPRLVDLHSGDWTGPADYALREDARVFELWECSVADRLGLIKAAEYALDLGLPAIRDAVRSRSAHLREGLRALDGVRVTDLGDAGLVTFTVEGRHAEEVKDLLAAAGVIVTVSYVGSTRLDMTRRGLDSVVRASPHYFVEPAQLDQAVERVSRIAR